MADEGTILTLSGGVGLLAMAFAFGQSWIGLFCGVFGVVMVMMAGLTLFMAKVENRRGD